MNVLRLFLLAIWMCLPGVAFGGGAVYFKDGQCPEFVLPRNVMSYIQSELKRQGIYKGPIDGQNTELMIYTIHDFRVRRGLPGGRDGYVDLALLKELLGAEFEKIADRDLRLRECMAKKNQ